MSDTAFAQHTIREAFPPHRHGSVYSAQCEAQNFLNKFVEQKVTLRRVRSFWEGTAKIVRGEEKDALRRAKIEEARNEHAYLLKRLSELDAALADMDAEFARGPR